VFIHIWGCLEMSNSTLKSETTSETYNNHHTLPTTIGAKKWNKSETQECWYNRVSITNRYCCSI